MVKLSVYDLADLSHSGTLTPEPLLGCVPLKGFLSEANEHLTQKPMGQKAQVFLVEVD